MKAQRNDKCPCGSGLKYKNCCLKSDEQKDRQKELQEQLDNSGFIMITGEENINNHLNDVRNVMKKEWDYMLKEAMSPYNIPLHTIRKPDFTWTGSPLYWRRENGKSRKFRMDFYFDKEFGLKIRKGKPGDYLVQVTDLETGSSLLLGSPFHRNSTTDWSGQKYDLSDTERALTSLLLLASEGTGPFYVMEDLTKTVADDMGSGKFFSIVS